VCAVERLEGAHVSIARPGRKGSRVSCVSRQRRRLHPVPRLAVLWVRINFCTSTLVIP
jgi:hypothetical protein